MNPPEPAGEPAHGSEPWAEGVMKPPDGPERVLPPVTFVADLRQAGADGGRPADKLLDPGGLGVVERVVQVGVQLLAGDVGHRSALPATGRCPSV